VDGFVDVAFRLKDLRSLERSGNVFGIVLNGFG
jgi:hypothetical protein